MAFPSPKKRDSSRFFKHNTKRARKNRSGWEIFVPWQSGCKVMPIRWLRELQIIRRTSCICSSIGRELADCCGWRILPTHTCTTPQFESMSLHIKGDTHGIEYTVTNHLREVSLTYQPPTKHPKEVDRRGEVDYSQWLHGRVLCRNSVYLTARLLLCQHNPPL